MTRLLERLEHVLGHAPRRATAPRPRLDRRPDVEVPTVPTTSAPSHRHPSTADPVPDPAAGFEDCRGEWHAWEDAS